MELITKAELARRVGVTRQAIGDAVNKGRLDEVGEGRSSRIDYDAQKTHEYLMQENAQRKSKAAGEPPESAGPAGQVEKGQRPVQGKLPEPTPSQRASQRQPLSPPSKLPSLDGMTDEQMRSLSRGDIERLQGIEKIKSEQIKNAKARMLLIERSLVAITMGKIYQVDSTQLLTLRTRLSPEIASLAKVDKPEIILAIEQAIETEVYATLGHIKKVMNKFLKEVEAQPIAD